jgi:hypothetical protein
MQLSADFLSDFPLRKFCSLVKTETVYNEYVYLLNHPIRGIVPEKSSNKISIGSRGFIRYLNAVTYNLGYIFEVPRAYTTMYPTHILIGSISSEIDHIGEVSTLYFDNNIIVLQNKRHSSYIVLPTYAQDIPQPIA